MPAKNAYPLKLSGHINWVWGTGDDALLVPVKRALLRSSDEVVLTCESEGWQYDVRLKRARGCRFEGDFYASQGQKLVNVSASCTLYSNQEGYLLFGKWLEEGWELFWWAELLVVNHFEDEK